MTQYGDAYPMVLNNVFIGMISLRSDQKNYFNIPDATTAELAFVNYGKRSGGCKNDAKLPNVESNNEEIKLSSFQNVVFIRRSR